MEFEVIGKRKRKSRRKEKEEDVNRIESAFPDLAGNKTAVATL